MLSSFFTSESQGQIEQRRLIWREKGMIPDNKVLAIPQLSRIITDTVDPETLMGEFFMRYFIPAQEHLFRQQDAGEIESFNIPMHMLTEELQRERLGIDDPDMPIDDAYELTVARLNQEAVMNGFPPAFDEGENPVQILKSEPCYGFYISDIAKALADTALFTDNLAYYEEKSVRNNQGHVVLEFWRGVNLAKDYGTYFPDKKPPKGNKPDDDGGVAKITDWVKGLGGLRPANA